LVNDVLSTARRLEDDIGVDGHPFGPRQCWRTKLELAIAMADYIEHFHNSARRHGALGYLTPNEFEELHLAEPQAK
jgi:transposase InsO family protein